MKPMLKTLEKSAISENPNASFEMDLTNQRKLSKDAIVSMFESSVTRRVNLNESKKIVRQDLADTMLACDLKKLINDTVEHFYRKPGVIWKERKAENAAAPSVDFDRFTTLTPSSVGTRGRRAAALAAKKRQEEEAEAFKKMLDDIDIVNEDLNRIVRKTFTLRDGLEKKARK